MGSCHGIRPQFGYKNIFMYTITFPSHLTQPVHSRSHIKTCNMKDLALEPVKVSLTTQMKAIELVSRSTFR